MQEELRDEPRNNPGVKGRVWGPAGGEAQGARSWAAGGCGWAVEQPQGSGADGQGHGDGGQETCWLSCEVSFGLCNGGGGCGSLVVFPAVSGSLLSPDCPAEAWSQGTSPERGQAWRPTEQLCSAQLQRRRGGRCAWIEAPAQSSGCLTYHRSGSRT